ncbi:EF-hand domain-containing protein [Tolypothrix sp. VBCCA 56010]|uniref:EF-hand domain-containing protein n=1 Tax=Tolypothrix sp. VBCCA 56010 TaxID=3137731 RepID=UPI003D7C5772
MTEQEVAKLWEAFQMFDEDGNSTISAEELGQVMRSLGQNPSDTELRDMIKEVDVDLSGAINFEEFKALMVSQQGDRNSRLALAFSVFDENGTGEITADEMRAVMSQFGLTDQELDEIIKEVDHDGDASIDFEEFCKLVPESETAIGYKDSPIPLVTPKTTATDGGVAPTTEDTTEKATTELEPEIARLKEQLAQHPQSEQKRGTSRLQMQIGLFRLIQGAAYRCFRESFSANHETHLRVRNLPYRITDFLQFLKTAIALYKGLGVVEAACNPVLDAVVESLTDEYARLEERIKNWKTIEKTTEMLAEEKAMLEARRKSANVKDKFAAGVEFAITLKKKRFSLRDIAEGVLAINELNRLRKMELNQEMAPPPAKSEEHPKEYLKKWNRVILSQASEEVDGAMMPVNYWYHKDEKAFYTTRYWPSLDTELARAKALKHISIASDRIYRLYGMLKPASRLSGARTTLQKLLQKGDWEGIKEACLVAQDYIKDLESAVQSGQFLQETYSFDPHLVDKAPYFTPEEEEFSRSGVFVELS